MPGQNGLRGTADRVVAQKHAMLVAYGGGHMKMILPVATELENRGWRTSIVALTSAGPYLRERGVSHVTYRDFVEPGDDEALAQGERLADALHNPESGMAREESVAYLGLSYQDLVERTGADEAARTFADRGRHAFLPVRVMERFIRRLDPMVVIATNSPKSERASQIAARNLGRASVMLSDLFGVREMYRYESDLVCVLSEITRRNLIADGVAPASMRVTGNPALDPLAAYAADADRGWRQRELRIPADEPVVLWADQTAYWRHNMTELYTPTPREIVANLDALADACSALGAHLLVRPHPSQPRQLFCDWAADTRRARVRVADRWPLYPLLLAADAVGTVTSTVGMEAIMLGRPVFTVNLGGPASDVPLADYGLAIAADEKAAILPVLRRLLLDETVRARMAAAQAPLRPDGQAAHRVVTEIELLMERRSVAAASEEGSRHV